MDETSELFDLILLGSGIDDHQIFVNFNKIYNSIPSSYIHEIYNNFNLENFTIAIKLI